MVNTKVLELVRVSLIGFCDEGASFTRLIGKVDEDLNSVDPIETDKFTGRGIGYILTGARSVGLVQRQRHLAD